MKEYKEIFRRMSSEDIANSLHTMLCSGKECDISLKFTLESIGKSPKDEALEKAIELLSELQVKSRGELNE